MKKFLSILLTICLFAISIVPAMAVEYNDIPEYAFGDVNLDGRVSIQDATIIQKHIAGLAELTDIQKYVADVGGNNKVDITDATMIQKYIASLIHVFPVEKGTTMDEIPTTPENTEPEDTTIPTTEVPTEPEITEPDVTEGPTEEPTEVPTEIPTVPTTEPIEDPTEPTTEMPTEKPTEPVTEEPTEVPTEIPTVPTTEPVEDPTEPTTEMPTEKPTEPTTEEPTEVPTEMPTEPEPTEPTTEMPTETPTEPEPTEPIIPNIETYGPIDPIEGDILTAEMLWKIEEEFFRLVNEERVRVGVKPLTYNKHLDDMAQIRSTEIIELLSHTRPNGEIFWKMVDVNEYNYKYLGENACELYYIPNGVECFIGSDEQVVNAAKEVFTAFKNSPGHYQNIVLEHYENTGIGISYVWHADLNVPTLFMSQIFGVEKK